MKILKLTNYGIQLCSSLPNCYYNNSCVCLAKAMVDGWEKYFSQQDLTLQVSSLEASGSNNYATQILTGISE